MSQPNTPCVLAEPAAPNGGSMQQDGSAAAWPPFTPFVKWVIARAAKRATDENDTHVRSKHLEAAIGDADKYIAQMTRPPNDPSSAMSGQIYCRNCNMFGDHVSSECPAHRAESSFAAPTGLAACAAQWRDIQKRKRDFALDAKHKGMDIAASIAMQVSNAYGYCADRLEHEMAANNQAQRPADTEKGTE